MFETRRLLIRPFVGNDLKAIHRILDQTFGDGAQSAEGAALAERRSWLQWSILNQEWLPKMFQPPYGDRGVLLKETGTLIGAVGFVPLLGPYEQIPALRTTAQLSGFHTPEVGLFWVIDPHYQGQGYATEAGQSLINYAFQKMRLKRILAATEYGNHASQAVMRKLGMTIEHNPLPDPAWLQMVGVLENRSENQYTAERS